MSSIERTQPFKHSLLRRLLIRTVGHLKFGNEPKVFGIGFNKTGTTSLGAALKTLGYTVAFQETAELTFKDWEKRDFNSIIDYCKFGGNAFQDSPFSLPFTFQALDLAFPNSKFILTVRDSSEQWHNSVMQFHTKRFGNGETVTVDDYRKADYLYPGHAYEAFKAVYHTNDEDFWNPEQMIKVYERHNANVKDYFFNRPNDLLVLNVAQDGAMNMLCDFLGKPVISSAFPKENESKNY